MLRRTFLIISLVGMGGCQTASLQPPLTQRPDQGIPTSPLFQPLEEGETSEAEDTPAPKTLAEILSPLQDRPRPHLSMQLQNGELRVQGVRLKNTRFDLPVVVNSKVEYWVEYFCGRGRKYFEKYLERSEFFIPFITPILKHNGLPEDLVYLAMMESGFHPLARSHAQAVGTWQFMSGTGKAYGLKINWWIDERKDIERSTLAAIDYLRNLYLAFGSWELVATAYNAGPGKVSRALNRFGTSDFWALARHQFFRPETRNYFPKIIAAAIIAKNRDQFGFTPHNRLSLTTRSSDVIPLPLLSPESLSSEPLPKEEEEREDSSSEEPETEEGDSSEAPSAESEEEEPADALSRLLQENEDPASIPLEKRDFSLPVSLPSTLPPLPFLGAEGESGAEKVNEFQVQSPADLWQIARAARISLTKVKALNPGILRWCTPPFAAAQRVRLPEGVRSIFLETYNQSHFPKKVTFLEVKSKPGETLLKIASQRGLKVDPLLDLNPQWSVKQVLQRGSSVLLPLPIDRSRSLGSLGVLDPPSRSRKGKGGRHLLKRRKIRVKGKSASSGRL